MYSRSSLYLTIIVAFLASAILSSYYILKYDRLRTSIDGDRGHPMIKIATNQQADAYVTACFSDPGIQKMRDQLGVPVLGIGESSALEAISLGNNVGIISSVEAAIPRHNRYWKHLEIKSKIIADIATGRGVLDLESEEAYNDIRATGEQLTRIGADVLVLGCTGMAHLRPRLQEELGVPIVEPCQAALKAATLIIREK